MNAINSRSLAVPTGPVDPAREFVIDRTYRATPEAIFAALTEPARLARWYGPRGFTLTTHAHELRPGGQWRFTMHGPDKHDYPNLVTFLEIDPPRRLVYQHTDASPTESTCFLHTMTIEPVGEGKTRLTMRLTFRTPEEKNTVMGGCGAADGAVQTLDRLGKLLEETPGAGPAPFVFTRVVKAPPARVFKAWTTPADIEKWFGPRGMTASLKSFDLRPGGVAHYSMKLPDGTLMWGKWVFREIQPPHRLVYVISFSDEHGGLGRHPLSPTWPREMLTTVTFEPHAGYSGGTTVTVAWTPINPSELEIATFDAARDGMVVGWTGSFDQLDAYFREILPGGTAESALP